MNYTTYDNNDLAPRPTAGQAMLAPARVLEDGDNYNLALDNGTVLPLIRDVDFGVIPGTKKPCLYKSGAERLVMSMGVRTEFILESAIEQLDADEPFCFYRVKCVCYALNPHTGEWMHITDGHGSANTRERQVGRSSCWDTANARLKMAEKRALVDVALRLGQLSNMFAQDIENEEFTAKETKVVADGDTISPQQQRRVYALASQFGKTTNECKAIIAEFGYKSASAIAVKDYDKICNRLKGEGKQ